MSIRVAKARVVCVAISPPFWWLSCSPSGTTIGPPGIRPALRARTSLGVVERWATFDCYGTLVDWPGGIGDQLERLFGADRRQALLERYFALEPVAQRDGALPYRDVM